MNYAELIRLGSAEALMVVTALVALGADLGLGRPEGSTEGRTGPAVALGVMGCVIVVVWLGVVAPEGALGVGMLVSDPLTRWVKLVLVALTGGALLLSARAEFTPHRGEYVATVLLGAVGMMLVVSTENLLMMFLALELASLSLYVLTGFDKRDPAGTEAALKYFLFGGASGGFLLMGLSFLYGSTGAIGFGGLAASMAAGPASPLLLTGVVLVLVGLGFKVAAVPFHFWAPDAYQGAPAPAAAFLASGSKVAAFFVFAKLALVALGPVAGSGMWGGWMAGWAPVVAVLAAASMVWGNFAALGQRNVKRLLAYSAVAHAGYTLVALVAAGPGSLAAVVFYASTYAVTVLGAFGVVAAVEREAGGSDLDHFVGLSRRSPALAVCLAVFVLSLAGIPPLVGFVGKFYLFLVALNAGAGSLGLLWLVALGAATTCVAFYYYLRILKAAFVERGAVESSASGGCPEAERWTLAVVAALVVVAGCLPELLLGPLQGALVAVGL